MCLPEIMKDGYRSFHVTYPMCQVVLHAPEEVPYLNHPQQERELVPWGTIFDMRFNVSFYKLDNNINFVTNWLKYILLLRYIIVFYWMLSTNNQLLLFTIKVCISSNRKSLIFTIENIHRVWNSHPILTVLELFCKRLWIIHT